MTRDELILEIKQRVFQNNNQLITGINLQNTLIDMVNFFYDNAEGQKLPARYTTKSTITLSGLGVQANGDWGSSLTAGDRILVKNQASSIDNGLYSAAAGAWTRTTDFDEDAEVIAGALVIVTEGTSMSDSLWELTTNNPIIIDTTPLNFTRIGADVFFVIEAALAAIETLKNNSMLVPGAQYHTTDLDEPILLLATNNQTLALKGNLYAKNADYQNVGNYSGVTGFTTNKGIWTVAIDGTAADGDVVIWNNLHYKVTAAGSVDGTNPATNTAAYTLLLKSDADQGYITEVDSIEYDSSDSSSANWGIISRKDKRDNFINTSLVNNTNLGFNPIDRFQWGRTSVEGNINNYGELNNMNALNSQSGIKVFGGGSITITGKFVANNSKFTKSNILTGSEITVSSANSCEFFNTQLIFISPQNGCTFNDSKLRNCNLTITNNDTAFDSFMFFERVNWNIVTGTITQTIGGAGDTEYRRSIIRNSTLNINTSGVVSYSDTVIKDSDITTLSGISFIRSTITNSTLNFTGSTSNPDGMVDSTFKNVTGDYTTANGSGLNNCFNKAKLLNIDFTITNYVINLGAVDWRNYVIDINDQNGCNYYSMIAHGDADSGGINSTLDINITQGQSQPLFENAKIYGSNISIDDTIGGIGYDFTNAVIVNSSINANSGILGVGMIMEDSSLTHNASDVSQLNFTNAKITQLSEITINVVDDCTPEYSNSNFKNAIWNSTHTGNSISGGIFFNIICKNTDVTITTVSGGIFSKSTFEGNIIIDSNYNHSLVGVDFSWTTLNLTGSGVIIFGQNIYPHGHKISNSNLTILNSATLGGQLWLHHLDFINVSGTITANGEFNSPHSIVGFADNTLIDSKGIIEDCTIDLTFNSNGDEPVFGNRIEGINWKGCTITINAGNTETSALGLFNSSKFKNSTILINDEGKGCDFSKSNITDSSIAQFNGSVIAESFKLHRATVDVKGIWDMNGSTIKHSNQIFYLYNDNPKITNEVIAVGDGTTGPYAFSLANFPIMVGQANPFITDLTEYFTDNGDGTLTGDNGGTGTIDYNAGTGSLTFGSAVTMSQNITATYRIPCFNGCSFVRSEFFEMRGKFHSANGNLAINKMNARVSNDGIWIDADNTAVANMRLKNGTLTIGYNAFYDSGVPATNSNFNSLDIIDCPGDNAQGSGVQISGGDDIQFDRVLFRQTGNNGPVTGDAPFGFSIWFLNAANAKVANTKFDSCVALMKGAVQIEQSKFTPNNNLIAATIIPIYFLNGETISYKRVESGFSNLETEIDITGLTTLVLVDQTKGIHLLKSTNATESIDTIQGYLQIAHPFEIRPDSNVLLTIVNGTALDKPRLAGGVNAVLDGSKGDFIVLQKKLNKQIVDLTLSGTSGTADIYIDGDPFTATFNTNLNTTAADFVTANAASILSTYDLIVTAGGSNNLIFTSTEYGVYNDILISNTSGNLFGIVTILMPYITVNQVGGETF